MNVTIIEQEKFFQVVLKAESSQDSVMLARLAMNADGKGIETNFFKKGSCITWITIDKKVNRKGVVWDYETIESR